MFTRCIAVFVVTLFVAGLACAVAFAAEDNSPVSLDLKDADVKSAIESLFRGRNRNYSVSQDVTGIIPSLSITGVPFDQALKSLLKSAGLVYRVENNVYMISKKPDTSTMPTVDPSAAAALDGAAVDTTTTVESVIDKVPLSNTGASEILAIMKGNNSNQSGYGMGGMMGGMGGMMGGMGGGFGSSSFGGSSFGGSSFGGSSFGGGSYGGSYGGSGRSGGYSSGGYRSW